MSEGEDETDLNVFKNIFKKKSKNQDDYEKTEIAKDSDVYNMEHYKRGTAIIFNHYEFDYPSIEKREGTEKDVEALTEVFKSMLLDVCVCEDYTYGQVYDKLNEVSESDHSDSDCLVVVVLSHGDEGKIYAKDADYPPDTLWNPFSGDRCPTLAGKPKIFFIQACRGSKVDPGAKRTFLARDSSAAATYTIPAMADMLVMYSTYDGYYSWRNPVTGSWFIQCLCEELKQYLREKDLMSILTGVNMRMALEFESNVPDVPEMNEKKQIGSIVSTLTRLLYFYT